MNTNKQETLDKLDTIVDKIYDQTTSKEFYESSRFQQIKIYVTLYEELKENE